MKTNFPWIAAAVALFALWVSIPRGRGGAPQPSFIFYGLASDEFGWPYLTNASVTLSINGKTSSVVPIAGMTAPGVNFTFRVPMDSGNGPLYDGRAARIGDSMRITMLAAGVEKTLMPITPFPIVGRSGEIRRMNVTVGTDSSGDGLPDEWKQWILQNTSDPRLKTIADVRPEDDADGDGVSNLAKYLAGTDPAWAQDYFRIEAWQTAGNGRLELKFLTIPGKTYRIFSAVLAADLGSRWQPSAFASSPSAALQTGPIIGTGHYLSVFVESPEPARLYQVQVK